MAGRILPVALSVIVGVSIGVATFDGEFKKQRIARMEEEYQRELAAANASGSAGSSTKALSTVPSPTPEPIQAKKVETVAAAPADNSWSNILGLWAWKKDTGNPIATVAKPAEDVKGKP